MLPAGRRLSVNKQENLPQKAGSSSLEAVLVLPLLLLLLFFMLGQVLAVTAKIKLQGALWRTADELALLGPAALYVSQLENELIDELALPQDQAGQDLLTVLASILPDDLIQELLAGAVLDLAATNVLGPLALARLHEWLDLAEAGQPGPWRSTISDLALFIDWQGNKRQAWLCLTWQQKLPLASRSASLEALVPLWTGQTSRYQIEKPDDSSLWLLDNFARGQAFRQQMGANLPYDFPVLAQFSGGNAVSVKSIDLTAPTYATASAVRQQIRQHLGDLADFRGATYSKNGQEIVLDQSQIKSRQLLLVIPENANQAWLAQTLAQLSLEAGAAGISLEVRACGQSSRYQKTADSD